MSEQTDKWDRETALSKALAFHSNELPAPDADALLKTAEKFRAFLAGETAEPKPFRRGIPEPAERDGYIYFQFNLLPQVLYRVRALAEWDRYGTVQRLNAERDTEWHPAAGTLASKRGICQADGYSRISAREASDAITGYGKP